MTFSILIISIFLFFPLSSGPCISFSCLGHFKHVYDDDDDDIKAMWWWVISSFYMILAGFDPSPVNNMDKQLQVFFIHLVYYIGCSDLRQCNLQLRYDFSIDK